jgi:hypothetical protein
VGVLGSTTAPVSAAQIAALMGSEITPSGKTAKIAVLVKRSGFALAFKALTAGTAVVGWYQLPSGATLAGKGKTSRVLVATGRLTFPAPGSRTMKVRLTAAGMRLLRHVARLRLTARGTFTPTGKPPIVVTKSFALRR